MVTRAASGVAVAFVFSLSACSTLYKLDVTAYNNPERQLDKTYVILSGNPDVGVHSPEFKQYAAQVEKALHSKGYQRIDGDNLSAAALGVYVSAAMGDPTKRIHTVTTGIYERPYSEHSAAVVRSSGSRPTAGGGTGQTGQQATPVVTPTPEILAGYEETGFATTVYTKHLNLVAVDLQQYLKDIAAVGRSEAVPIEVWSVDIQTTGQPSDLSEVFAVMVAAAQPYVGNSTEEVVQVRMAANDKRVDAIKAAAK